MNSTGMSRVAGSAFNRRHVSYPSRPGIITSSRIRSGLARAATRRATSPPGAASTWYPSLPAPAPAGPGWPACRRRSRICSTVVRWRRLVASWLEDRVAAPAAATPHRATPGGGSTPCRTPGGAARRRAANRAARRAGFFKLTQASFQFGHLLCRFAAAVSRSSNARRKCRNHIVRYPRIAGRRLGLKGFRTTGLEAEKVGQAAVEPLAPDRLGDHVVEPGPEVSLLARG